LNAPRQLTVWQKATLFGASYFLCAEAGRYLSSQQVGFAGLWLPAGLYLAVLLLNPTREWGWMVVAAIPGEVAFNLLQGAGVAAAASASGAHAFQAVAGAWLMRRFVAEKPTLATLDQFWGLLGCATLLSPGLGATVSAFLPGLPGAGQTFGESWVRWWSANSMAIMTVSPFVLVWFSKPVAGKPDPGARREIVEGTFLLCGLGATIWYVMVFKGGAMSPYRVWVTPFLLYAGLRLGRHGATAATLLTTVEMAFVSNHIFNGITRAEIASGEYIFIRNSLLTVAPLIALLPAIMLAERKAGETRIRQLNRVHAVLSAINELMVREKNPQVMFEAACRIAVETGRFRMAWIGMLDEATQVVQPVASTGRVEGYLDTVKIDLKDTAWHAGPTARALLSGKHEVINDIGNDARTAPWREAAMRRGYLASAAFPLKVGGTTVGVLNLYAAERDFFDADELRLLDDLAADIGFALEVRRQEAERQRVEQSLHASERQFAHAFDNTAIGMALVAPDGRWLKVNRALCKMVGYTAEELCSLSFQQLTHPGDLSRDLAELKRLVLGEIETHQTEKRYLHKDGSVVTVHISVSMLRDDQRRPSHMITQIQDVTSARQLEEQFRQSQKIEAIGQLAGGVAHDFNNILAVLMMQAELATMVPNLPAEAAEGLRQIRAAAERAANLTRQLLLFSRRQVMQAQDLDLNDAVTSLAKMLQRIIGEDVRLQLLLHPAPLFTHADAGMLDQVLMNLAVNARDAMPKGGLLTIATSEEILDEATARSRPDTAPGRYACLRVADRGCGIPPEIMSRIFEPFFTTKEPGKGTGLGLATVFGIVKQHRGWIEVKSEPGRGTEIRIGLPTCAVPAEAAELPKREKPPGGTETILLAEDDAALRGLTRTTLERQGYKVLEAASGAEAVKLWPKRRAEVSLLLTDLVMPGGTSGVELARLLRADKPGLKVIYTSGYSAEIAGRELRLDGGELFVQKPCSPDDLLKDVRNCLDGAVAGAGVG
jgi:PAS domain S-box-containing protein